MPALCAEIAPALVMPPENVETVATSMPILVAEITPRAALTMPPENVETLTTPMPVFGSIRPELVMPPPKAETAET